jgi:hypothetical protein
MVYRATMSAELYHTLAQETVNNAVSSRSPEKRGINSCTK